MKLNNAVYENDELIYNIYKIGDFLNVKSKDEGTKEGMSRHTNAPIWPTVFFLLTGRSIVIDTYTAQN